MVVKKVVIPVAGKGTRFLPVTKALPKEMIPIINRPMIEYVVDEAVDMGATHIIFVTSSGKVSIEDYFDRNIELEVFLENKGKLEELELIKNVSRRVEIVTVRQKEQLGLGHALLQAEPVIGNESFAVLLGDDLVLSKVPVAKQLWDISEAHNNSPVIGVMEVERRDTKKYGIVDGTYIDTQKRLLKMTKMVEKPDPSVAPTLLATPGRYILNKEIFTYLKKIKPGAGGEYQLTDAINEMCREREVLAYQFEGERFDTGHVEGHLDATLEFALRDPHLKPNMLKMMRNKLEKYKESL